MPKQGFFKKGGEETIKSLTEYACSLMPMQDCDSDKMEKVIRKTLFNKSAITKLWDSIEADYYKKNTNKHIGSTFEMLAKP